jgi:CelD/BcsL family acetyltransferase involved in cellulose biosynthesis
MPDGVDFRVLRTSGELESIEPTWRTLWLSDSNATPFQSPAWLLPWVRQFGQPDLRTILVSRSRAPIGLLPFYVYRDPHTSTRKLLLLGAGTSDYLDGIFAPVCTAEHIREAVQVLDENRDWNIAALTQLRAGSRLLQALAPNHQPFATETCSRMPALPVAGLPRKIRQNVNYNRNRAHRQGTLEFTLASHSDCLELFQVLVRQHTDRWRERGASGVLSDPRVLAWHRQAIPLLAREGLLRLSALRHNGEIIATMYALIDPPGRPARTLYVYLPAFSRRHATLSPGTLLLAKAIEHACANGVEAVDLLRGDEPYKQLWHSEKTPTWGLELHSFAQPQSAALTQAA